MLVDTSSTLEWLAKNGGIASNYTGLFVMLYLILDKIQNWRGSPEFRVVATELQSLNQHLETLIERLI
jgi:hypothetical protein